MFVTERKAAMGKLAEIKDMEEAVEQENNEAKEFTDLPNVRKNTIS